MDGAACILSRYFERLASTTVHLCVTVLEPRLRRSEFLRGIPADFRTANRLCRHGAQESPEPLPSSQRLTAAEAAVAVLVNFVVGTRLALAALAWPVQIEYLNLTPLVYLLAGFTRRIPEDVAAVKLACT